MALYREGINETNHVFKFLSFFKVIEVLVTGREPIINLAAKYLSKARMSAAASLALEEQPTTTDDELARYLYEDGRCAIAHAYSEPLIDPDDPSKTRNIAIHVPLARSLAEVVIEEELGVSRWWPKEWRPDWGLIVPEGSG